MWRRRQRPRRVDQTMAIVLVALITPLLVVAIVAFFAQLGWRLGWW